MAKKKKVMRSRKKAKVRKLWLGKSSGTYDIFKMEPDRRLDGSFVYLDNWLATIRDESFHKFSAIRLKPGECVQVEFTDPFKLVEARQ